jgi:hypothetical protein
MDLPVVEGYQRSYIDRGFWPAGKHLSGFVPTNSVPVPSRFILHPVRPESETLGLQSLAVQFPLESISFLAVSDSFKFSFEPADFRFRFLGAILSMPSQVVKIVLSTH